jgi:hypothetical protein
MKDLLDVVPEAAITNRQAKWISFVITSATGKTCRWMVLAQGGGCLGVVKWYSGWRRYCFFPEMGTLYEQDCLLDIAAFCEEVTAMHKAPK